MARETITSVKRHYGQRITALQAAVDELKVVHAAEIKQMADLNDGLALRNVKGFERHAAELAAKDKRIDELFRSNNDYQAEARVARAETARLQAALSDAARVIAALGQRAEG